MMRKVGTAKTYYDQSNGLLRKIIPAQYIEQLKEAVLFRPDDTHDLHQIPPANMKSEAVARIQVTQHSRAATCLNEW